MILKERRDILDSNVIIAFLLTLLAGVSTGLGGIIAFRGGNNDKFLSGALGFSAGVMLYVSFMEIMPQAISSLQINNSPKGAEIYSTLAFFGGMAVIAVIDLLIPDETNPHEYRDEEELKEEALEEQLHQRKQGELLKMGKLSATAIAIHNFPEGLATFMATLVDPTLGVSIAVAIAIHNIPEGIVVSAPIYYATGDKKEAVVWAFASGLAEPIGALIGYLVLRPFLTDSIMGIVFGVVAGIIVYISMDELLPTAEKYAEHHIAIGGLIAGMIVMAVSLILL